MLPKKHEKTLKLRIKLKNDCISYGYATKETSVKLHSVKSSLMTAICGQPCTMYDVPTMTLRIVHIVHGPQNNRRMQ